MTDVKVSSTESKKNLKTDNTTNVSKNTYYNKKNELEIIKKYNDLIMYVYIILKKFPLDESMNLSLDIKKALFAGLESLIFAKKSRDNNEKKKYLITVESEINYLNLLIRISKKNKFITAKNYTVWSHKVVEIENMLEKWVFYCQR